MTTTDQIRRRVEQADTARSTKRAAAAQQIGELAQRRAALAEQIDDLERQLGDLITAANDVITIAELATFTDVRAADLTRWCEARKTTRAKRKRSTTSPTSPTAGVSRRTSVARTPAGSRSSSSADHAVPGRDAADAPARSPVPAT